MVILGKTILKGEIHGGGSSTSFIFSGILQAKFREKIVQIMLILGIQLLRSFNGGFLKYILKISRVLP